MKHVGSFISKLSAYGVAFLIASFVGSVHAQQQQGTATVRALRGTAQYTQDGGAWMPLTVGKVLKQGAVVRTAANSQVDLFLRQNGPVVRVTADTTLGLDKLLFEDTGTETVIDTQLNLTNGRILGTVKKMAAVSKYEVKIPTGVVGIRGTEYDISTSGIVHIVTGQALVTYITPNKQIHQAMVNEGETFTPPTVDPEAPPTVTPTPPAVQQQIKRDLPPVTPTDRVVLDTGGVVVVEPVQQPVSPISGGGATSGGTSGGGHTPGGVD